MNEIIILQQDELAIRHLLKDVVIAFNNADLEKLLSYHTEDIILMEPDQPIIQGKNQVRKLFAEFENKRIEMHLDFNILEMEVSFHLAFVRGQVMKKVFQNCHVSKEETGKFICLLKKQQDATWLRTHVIVNYDAPPYPLN